MERKADRSARRVIVVGGGAAGMMAAIAAAAGGAEVSLIEQNEKLGKKLFLTGKGRCNVTNAGDAEDFFANVCTNAKFLYSAFYGYDNQAVMDLLERAGCPLKVERGGRVFPASDHSSDVTAALKRELSRLGVRALYHKKVVEILTRRDESAQGNRCQPDNCCQQPRTECSGRQAKSLGQGRHFAGVRLSDGSVLEADKGILCTGGLSYPATGATGDGLRFAEALGHRFVEARPALVPLTVKESWCGELMGLSLKNVSLRMLDGERELYHGFGEMLFTHFGVSGPLALSASSFYGRRRADGGNEVRLLIDLKPALDEETLDLRLLRDFEEHRNKQFCNALGGLFPAKLIPVMIRLSGILPDKKVNGITREERRGFLEKIKALPLTVTGTRPFEEAIITQGGVSVKDVNPSTMESKLVKGLYFAGEVLDLDAMTGGYNLQIAWSTGYLAGESAAVSE